jgi:hypothetical protein
MTGRTAGAVGSSPSPSQRWVAAIHEKGMKTGTRANRLPTPRVRSSSTNALSALVMAPAA